MSPAQVTLGGDQANSVGPSYQKMPPTCEPLPLHYLILFQCFRKRDTTLFLQQVQVIGLLCRTPKKESRQELLRRVAAGGGVFKSENGVKVQLPAANLNDIANQADDLLEVERKEVSLVFFCIS